MTSGDAGRTYFTPRRESSLVPRRKVPFAEDIPRHRCGQNPTGSTLGVERRKAIYAIAQKYDLIIVEDGEHRLVQPP